MSEEKKCLNNEELPEGVTELSMEDLEQITSEVKTGTLGACLIGPAWTPDGYEVDASGAWTGKKR